MSVRQEYRHAQEIARRITGEVGEPSFYGEQKKAVETSSRLFREHPLVTKAITVLGADPDRLGHGLSHVTKVAVDAGAIILVERQKENPGDRAHRLVALAHVAGVLHDIKREEKDHARKGAEEAERILRDFDFSEAERYAIAGAIANH
jgi:HD superfamily phosphodiesterase